MTKSGARSTGPSRPDLPRARRGGRYFRLAEPEWHNPLDGAFAKAEGGRWNAPGSFAVVYLNATEDVARANVVRRLGRIGVSWEDLDEARRPDLVATDVPRAGFLDVVTDAGCRVVGLPITYPRDRRGAEIPWDRCQPVGHAAHGAGLAGVACRSAATRRTPYGEELAWFQRGRARLPARGRRAFDEWFAPCARRGTGPGRWARARRRADGYERRGAAGVRRGEERPRAPPPGDRTGSAGRRRRSGAGRRRSSAPPRRRRCSMPRRSATGRRSGSPRRPGRRCSPRSGRGRIGPRGSCGQSARRSRSLTRLPPFDSSNQGRYTRSRGRYAGARGRVTRA